MRRLTLGRGDKERGEGWEEGKDFTLSAFKEVMHTNYAPHTHHYFTPSPPPALFLNSLAAVVNRPPATLSRSRPQASVRLNT